MFVFFFFFFFSSRRRHTRFDCDWSSDVCSSDLHAAAFADPRFPQLRLEEKAALEIQVSVLSDLEPMDVQSEYELLEQLRPGIDGVLLEHDGRRSTFLPAVWKRLPDPERFLLELKHKA